MSTLIDNYHFSQYSISNIGETTTTIISNKKFNISSNAKYAVNKIFTLARGANGIIVGGVSTLLDFIAPVYIYGENIIKYELFFGVSPELFRMI